MKETQMIDLNISLRDYFAAHCPEEELPKQVTEGDIIKAFNISDTGGTRLDPDFRRSATVKIRCLARYAYADAMLEVRETEEVVNEGD